MGLPESLSRLRKKHGLRQIDIAERTGMPLRSYQHYERGEQGPTLSKLITLADFYGVTLDELVGRTPPESAGTDEEERGSE